MTPDRAGRTPRYYHDCSIRIPGHTTRAPPAGFELETNGFHEVYMRSFASRRTSQTPLCVADAPGIAPRFAGFYCRPARGPG